MPESGGDLRHPPDPVRGLRGAEHRSIADQEHQHSVYHQDICPIQIQERREQNLILLLNSSIDWCLVSRDTGQTTWPESRLRDGGPGHKFSGEQRLDDFSQFAWQLPVDR